MSVIRAIGYIPELKLKTISKQKIKLADNLFLLPEVSTEVTLFKKDISSKGFKIAGGCYLYFEGTLRQDGTLFEVFQGYSLALTFFQPSGQASCRAIKELSNKNNIELFIDEYDKFGYEIDSIITIGKKDLKEVKKIFTRVEVQLVAKKFNPLRNSLEFFMLFLNERKIRTRLLYLSIALESILLEGQSDGLSYKLGMRGANLLSIYYKNIDMESIFNELRNSYELRSSIIHGDDYQKTSARVIGRRGKTSTELDHVDTLESIVKDILSTVFSLEEFYELSISGGLGKEIDKRYILDSIS